MSKIFTNNYPLINLYKKMSIKSEIVTQIVYGQSFSIIKKGNKWVKIKIKEDNYKGYIQRKKFIEYIKPTHKICCLKAKVYKFPNTKSKKFELTFGSKIKVSQKRLKFLKFDRGWIKKKEVKKLNFKDKDIFKRIKLFKGVKYKWGGKSFKGIDCSALIQVCFNFNNKFCPRDAKDQFKFFRKDKSIKKIKKNDIIYWKGHVAVALSRDHLIHAYGPMKKTIIMRTVNTIKRIDRTAKLKVIGVKKI